MRIPLAPAGAREMFWITLMAGVPTVVAVVGIAKGCGYCWPAAVVFGLLWMWGMAFFRDPERPIPSEPGIMVSPADGTVTTVEKLDHHDQIGGPAYRISIFLSVFNVHVNRSPCDGAVREVHYVPGQFLDARHPKCGQVNECNEVTIEPAQPDHGPVIVRQISGAIARRIVCSMKVSEPLQRGQRIGLIKFGSRTDLIWPVADGYEPVVKVGDKVRGAATILARKRG